MGTELSVREVLHQPTYRSATMADGVFLVGGEFGKGAVEAVGAEDGIVTEAARAMGFGRDLARDFALKEALLAVEDEGDHRAEAGLPMVRIAECLE